MGWKLKCVVPNNAKIPPYILIPNLRKELADIPEVLRLATELNYDRLTNRRAVMF
jgi:hypothetical protein